MTGLSEIAMEHRAPPTLGRLRRPPVWWEAGAWLAGGNETACDWSSHPWNWMPCGHPFEINSVFEFGFCMWNLLGQQDSRTLYGGGWLLYTSSGLPVMGSQSSAPSTHPTPHPTSHPCALGLPLLPPHHCQPPSHWRWRGKPNSTKSLHPHWMSRRAGWSQSTDLGHLWNGPVLAAHPRDHWVDASVRSPCPPPRRSGAHHNIQAAVLEKWLPQGLRQSFGKAPLTSPFLTRPCIFISLGSADSCRQPFEKAGFEKELFHEDFLYEV